MSEETYKLYSSQLSDFPEDDLRAAIREIAHRARREGETAFPSLGEIVERVKLIAYTRRQEQRASMSLETQEAWFWQWVTERVEDTGQTEQQVLDAVKIAGFTGRKARNADK